MGDFWGSLFGGAGSIASAGGDISSQLAQFSPDQILAAYNSLVDTYQQESQFLTNSQQWLRDNGATLTDQGKQLYISALQNQTDVVNTFGSWTATAQGVLQSVGLLQRSGLSGTRRLGRLGALPILAWVAIIAVIVGVTAATISYWMSKSDQAKADMAKAQAQVQQKALDQVPQLVAAGWTPDQINKYLQSQNPPNNPLGQIPWTTLAIVGGVVLVARSIFS